MRSKSRRARQAPRAHARKISDKPARLRPLAGHKPKRAFTGACLDCDALKQKVPCNDLCCRHFLVPLAQEDLDDGLEPQPPFVDVLRRAPSGSCFYLDETTRRCRVWAKRPLACRAYDCRQDVARASRVRRIVLPPGSRFVPQSDRTLCRGCRRPRELAYDCLDACDGRAVCIRCGAAYEVTFVYGLQTFRLRFVQGLSKSRRLEYLLEVLLHQARWDEALALLARLLRQSPGDPALRLQRATALGELGRDAEACAELEGATSPEAVLLYAWLDRRAGRLASARNRVLSLLPNLEGWPRTRALLALGRIAREEHQHPSAARYLLEAFLRQQVAPNEVFREEILDMLRASPAERAAVLDAIERVPGAHEALGLRRDSLPT